MTFRRSILILAVTAAACGKIGTLTPPVLPPVPSAASAPVRDTRPEIYELQERCAKNAAAWYKHAWEDPKGLSNIVGSYTNHYYAKSGRCMLVVTSRTFGKSNIMVSKTLVDVLENRDVAEFDQASTSPQPIACQFDGVQCGSAQEWDSLAKPYMEQ